MVSCFQHSILLFPYPFCCTFHGGGDPCPSSSGPAYKPPGIQCYLPQPNSYYHLSTNLGCVSDAGPSSSRTQWRPREPSLFGSRWLTQLDVRGFCRRQDSGVGLFQERHYPSCSCCNSRMSVLGRPFARRSDSGCILPILLLEFVGVSAARSCRRVDFGGAAFAAVTLTGW
jgi:hypothetical protein